MKYMTPKWYMMCQELYPSTKTERFIHEAIEDYRKEYIKNFSDHEPDLDKAHLHDSVVLSVRQVDGDLMIALKPDITDISRLVFKDCKILNLDVFIGSRKPPVGCMTRFTPLTAGTKSMYCLTKGVFA